MNAQLSFAKFSIREGQVFIGAVKEAPSWNLL